jgi:hypothetical protein
MNIINKIGQYRSGEWYKRSVSSITAITVHHDAIPHQSNKTDEQLLDQIMRTHQGLDWPGMAYHFYITKEGTVYQVNDYTEITWHDKINNDSLGVCLNGYFHPDYNDKPTIEQLTSLKELLDYLCTQHPEFPADQDDVWGHRERPGNATACPGNNLATYVTEYRLNKGDVNWLGEGATECERKVEMINELLDETEDELDAMRESRNKWKTQYNDLEAKYTEDLGKKIAEVDALQKTLTQTNLSHQEATQKLSTIIAKLEDEADRLTVRAENAENKMHELGEQVLELPKLRNKIETLKKSINEMGIFEFLMLKFGR